MLSMNKQPLISVLIANYNNAKYISGAIKSIYSQTYQNWEIIIVDDASTDNSQQIYDMYVDDKRIKVYKNEKNHGVAFTRKRLIDVANSEYMCFLDPDDELTPNALEDHMSVHLTHPEVSIIYSRRYLCDEHLNIQDESRVLHIPEDKSYFTLKDFREEHLVSFKKSYYLQTEGMNPLYRLAEDTHMNFIMEEVGIPYCLDKICYKYRRSTTNQLTSDYARHMFWNMLVQYDTCKRRGINVESQIYEWFEDSVAFISKKQIYEKEIEVRNSLAYKIGNAILKPIKLIKSIVRK